jgi:hypothetical protein
MQVRADVSAADTSVGDLNQHISGADGGFVSLLDSYLPDTVIDSRFHIFLLSIYGSLYIELRIILYFHRKEKVNIRRIQSACRSVILV